MLTLLFNKGMRGVDDFSSTGVKPYLLTLTQPFAYRLFYVL